MMSVLLAVAPRGIPAGLPGALILLALGMGVVFLVLGGLTLLIWLIGKVARDRAPAATAAQPEAATVPSAAPAEPGAAVPTAPVDAPVATTGSVSPHPDTTAAAIAVAVAQTQGAGTEATTGAAIAVAVAQTQGMGAGTSPATAEAAAITMAILAHRSSTGLASIHEGPGAASEPGAGAWGNSGFAGRTDVGLPALRRS